MGASQLPGLEYENNIKPNQDDYQCQQKCPNPYNSDNQFYDPAIDACRCRGSDQYLNPTMNLDSQ